MPLIFLRFSWKTKTSLTQVAQLPYKSYDSVIGKPVQIRRGPATVSGEGGSRFATGILLGRQLSSDEPQARRPTEFISIRIDLEGRPMTILSCIFVCSVVFAAHSSPFIGRKCVSKAALFRVGFEAAIVERP